MTGPAKFNYLRSFLIATLSILFLISACHAGETRKIHADNDRGHLLLIGGGDEPGEAVKLFVMLARGDRKRIVVFTAATEETREAGDEYTGLFKKAGAGEVSVIDVKNRKDAFRKDHVEAVLGSGGVWFTGGDQNLITEKMLDTPLCEAIGKMKAAGGVVGGTSAGTACQSDPMITGEGEDGVIEEDPKALARGLGIYGGVIFDQHFVKRGRLNRLLAAVMAHPEKVGVGVDEATAIWIRPGGKAEVMGAGAVVVFDARKAKTGRAGRKLNADGIRTRVFTAGQAFGVFDGAE